MGSFHIRTDQRRRRSDRTQKALNYQLDYVQREVGMELIVLADHNGLVVASAGDEYAAKVFAVYACSLAQGDPPNEALTAVVPSVTADRIICRSITLDELPLYLCAVMLQTEENQAAFERARIGVQRIYYTTGEFTTDDYELT